MWNFQHALAPWEKWELEKLRRLVGEYGVIWTKYYFTMMLSLILNFAVSWIDWFHSSDTSLLRPSVPQRWGHASHCVCFPNPGRFNGSHLSWWGVWRGSSYRHVYNVRRPSACCKASNFYGRFFIWWRHSGEKKTNWWWAIDNFKDFSTDWNQLRRRCTNLLFHHCNYYEKNPKIRFFHNVDCIRSDWRCSSGRVWIGVGNRTLLRHPEGTGKIALDWRACCVRIFWTGGNRLSLEVWRSRSCGVAEILRSGFWWEGLLK